MRKLLKYQEFQVREAGSHEGDPRLSCVPVQGVGLRSLSSGQANDRLCLLYMKTDRPLGLITSLLEVTLSRLFYKLKWSCAVYHICWDTNFSWFFFTAFENTRFQLPPPPSFGFTSDNRNWSFYSELIHEAWKCSLCVLDQCNPLSAAEFRKCPLILIYGLIQSHLWRQEVFLYFNWISGVSAINHLKEEVPTLLDPKLFILTPQHREVSFLLYTRSMESLLVMTSDRMCPLYWMDGAILVSLRKQAKYCVALAPCSSLMVNESGEASSEQRLIILAHMWATCRRLITFGNFYR